jgi:hypothetical protein
VLTAAVHSQVLTVDTASIPDGVNSQYLTFLDLNITTPYPQAWSTFWNGQSALVPSGTTCVPGAGVPANRCLIPPPGTVSTVLVPLYVSELSLTTVLVQVSIL